MKVRCSSLATGCQTILAPEPIRSLRDAEPAGHVDDTRRSCIRPANTRDPPPDAHLARVDRLPLGQRDVAVRWRCSCRRSSMVSVSRTIRLASFARRRPTSASVTVRLRAQRRQRQGCARIASVSRRRPVRTSAAPPRFTGVLEKLTSGVASASFGASKILARLELERVRDQHRRELLDQRVVGLHGVVVDAARDRDLILGLERDAWSCWKFSVARSSRVLLGHHHQAADGGRQARPRRPPGVGGAWAASAPLRALVTCSKVSARAWRSP